MKTAVIFYSLDGNCALVAEEIKSQLNADLIRLNVKNEKNRGRLSKLIWSFGLMFSQKNPQLLPYTFDPSVYDLIVIGAPVWGGSPASPVRTFICDTAINGKKIALFVCHAGGMEKSLDKFKALLAGNEITGEKDFKNPLKRGSEEIKSQVADWVKGFKG